MSNSSQSASHGNASASTVAEALDKNKQAADEVERAADDLAVVHAVLDTKLARGHVADGEVAKAVAETNRVEKQLSESARKLDAVNDALERVVGTTR